MAEIPVTEIHGHVEKNEQLVGIRSTINIRVGNRYVFSPINFANFAIIYHRRVIAELSTIPTINFPHCIFIKVINIFRQHNATRRCCVVVASLLNPISLSRFSFLFLPPSNLNLVAYFASYLLFFFFFFFYNTLSIERPMESIVAKRNK